MITEEELQALQQTRLPHNEPFIIAGVTQSYFSVSRHTGGCTVNGYRYHYDPSSDELIRADVVKWLKEYRKNKKKERILKVKSQQLEMW